MPNFGSKKHFRHRILDGAVLGALDFGTSGTGPASNWHKLGIEGKWSGHWMGPFSLSAQIFEQVIQHFQASSVEIPCDYEHASVFSDRAPASGWIDELEVRRADDGSSELWGHVNWTEAASDHIRAKEYRYTSPTFVWNTRDRKSGHMTGASLHSLALTNKPFLHELPEVRLNSLRDALIGPEEDEAMTELEFKALCKALGLSENATPQNVIDQSKSYATAASIGQAALNQLKLEDGTTKEQVTGAILKLQNPARNEGEVAALRERLVALEAEKTAREAGDLVDSALKAGKLTAPGTDQHKWATEYALKDPEGFRAYIASAPVIVPNKTIQRSANVSQAQEFDPEAIELAQRGGLTVEELKKYNDPNYRPRF